MERPQVKVCRDGKMWGVKVKWPRHGPWTRTLIFPRFVWHGPLGMYEVRWPDSSSAISFANLVERSIENTMCNTPARTARREGNPNA